MAINKIEILKLVQDNSIKFLSSLIDIFPEEGDLIAARILLQDQVPIQEFTEKLAKKIIPLEDIIVSRNDKFFIEDNEVFMSMNKDKVFKWKAIWLSERLDEGDREAIWKWIDLFLQLSKLYSN